MVEVNVKAEIAKLEADIQQMAQNAQTLDQQMQNLNQRRQAVVNEIVKAQGALDAFRRLDGTEAAATKEEKENAKESKAPVTD